MPASPCILVLNHNRRNIELLEEFLHKAGFGTHPADSLEDVDAALELRTDFSLALLDLTGFDSGIWERCDHLRRSGIPFLVISPKPAEAVERTGLRRGAKGVLEKPLSTEALLAMIRTLIHS